MLRHRGGGAAGVGIAAAEVAACAHEHVNDGLEFFVAEVIDRTGMPRAPEDSNIGGGNIVEMLLGTGRRKAFGFVGNPPEFAPPPAPTQAPPQPLPFLPPPLP